MELPTIDRADVVNKRVFVRGDIDVPVSRSAGQQDRRIEDDTRLKDIWPTVEYLLGQGCTIYLAGHLGRPGGKVVAELSSRPVAEWVENKINEVNKNNKASNKITVLENLRFDPREESNDREYAKKLAGLADIYVNEAFAACEREHASIVGVPKFLPHFAGFRLAKEVEVLSGILEAPKRPLVVIIGGAKPETKQPLITKMREFADAVLVGGKLVSTDQKDTMIESIPSAGTIIWNGPLGEVESGHEEGTRKLIDLILAQKEAYKIVGGGDTVGFLNKLGLTDRFDWVSSGGGSMLKLLAGEVLPGVEALVS